MIRRALKLHEIQDSSSSCGAASLRPLSPFRPIPSILYVLTVFFSAFTERLKEATFGSVEATYCSRLVEHSLHTVRTTCVYFRFIAQLAKEQRNHAGRRRGGGASGRTPVSLAIEEAFRAQWPKGGIPPKLALKWRMSGCFSCIL